MDVIVVRLKSGKTEEVNKRNGPSARSKGET